MVLEAAPAESARVKACIVLVRWARNRQSWEPMPERESNDTGSGMVERPGTRRNLSKSATRALEILEYFALVGRPLRTVEIAQALNFHASSTDQLLKTLVDSAYLMFDARKKLYYPSPRLVNFGSWLATNYFGEDRICRLLQFVQQESGEIVTFSIRYGSSMQIVDFIEPLSRAGTVIKGGRVSIIGSVIGTAFLTLCSDREVIAVVEEICGESDRRLSVAELRDLLARVSDARRAGFVSGRVVNDADPWALAVPLPAPSSGMKMVLGVASDSKVEQDREKTLVELIHRGIGDWLQS